MNPSDLQRNTNKPTNENWTQRYVDYDKEEPQPRDISNDYIKEEMVGNVRGVFIKTRNLEPNEIENPPGGDNNVNDTNQEENINFDKNKVDDKNTSTNQPGMSNNLLNDKKFVSARNETTSLNPGNATSLIRPNESSINAGNMTSTNRGNEDSLNRGNESSFNRVNENQSLNPRNENPTLNAGNDTTNRVNEMPSLNPRNTTNIDTNTNRNLDTNQNTNKNTVAGSSTFNQVR